MTTKTTVKKTARRSQSATGSKKSAASKISGSKTTSASANRNSEIEAELTAIRGDQAVLEFRSDGTILSANQNFLDLTGYTSGEVVGRHYSLFVDPAYRLSDEYRQFWEKLARGQADQGQYQFLRKSGEELWLQAGFHPVKDRNGNLTRIVALVADITAAKRQQVDADSQLRSIGAYQAVIEFKLDGTIVTANQNFLDAVGYRLSEIQGKHHSIFVDPIERQSQEYRMFWDRLGRGEADAGQYKRIRKNGSDLWLQASYNPILDINGRPCKVVKYATDITAAKTKQADSESQLSSISSYQAVIEFKLDGTIVTANQNFLDAVGYTLSEIQGKHHSMFVDPIERQSQEYRMFWDRLGRGEADAGQYKRIRKNGSDLWLQASYNPIFDINGRPSKVVKYATDITAAKIKQADSESQLSSISTYQAVIEFKLDGTIVTANQNFLDAVGYTLSEIQGKHHGIFVDPIERQSQEYRMFWDRLGRGEANAGQYKRIRKNGSDLWLQASYNPILDLSGKPCKVVKYASDITAAKIKQADSESQLSSISSYQAVIEFKLDGTIVTANQNFLDAVGYTLSEIQGKHHGIFVDPAERQSQEYRLFWDKLGRGEANAGQYKRIRKNGSDLWLQASYNPILDLSGKPCKVVKYASDITAAKIKQADAESQLNSISTYQAVIEFKLDGTIVTANQNFLDAVGYTLSEIQGKHHSIFVDPAERQSQEYRMFWDKLGRGEASAGQYKRIRKNGSDLWLQASYNPILDLSGKPCKVVKYASDITAAKIKQADSESQLRSISSYQAVIEFKLDGTIVHANQNFLDATGYTLGEVQGKHHSMFVDPAYRQTQDYRSFWDRLGRGEADSGQYKRIRKNGSEVWLQASYNPILDLSGKPSKVIKYATDITDHKLQEQQMARAVAETGRVMKGLAEGDLSGSMSGQYDGEIAHLRDSVNLGVEHLRKMVTETSRVMKEVAGGDLRESVQGNFEGEFGKLRDSVNSCVDHLRQMVEKIRHAMSTMTVSSSEIAAGNLDLSQRTEEQAASLTTTAANMEQITATVKQNADNSREANSLASGARQQADVGGSVVNNAISAMGAIHEASKRIADIIGVIDDIAFQTNLLALNAAVEAARAGEQGRGFAVVAAEVRNLAQRSAGAAKEIKTLIKDSVGRVEEGSRLVNESGATLQQIVSAAKKVNDIISEISAASNEQSVGVQRIAQAIQQMDVAVQQNSALVEETAAASSTMDEHTRSLSTLMEFFKLSDNDSAFNAIPRQPANQSSSFGKSQTKPQLGASFRRPQASPSTPIKDSNRMNDFTMADEF